MSLLPKSRGGALIRFFVCAVLVVGLTAGATATAGLLQVKDVVDIITRGGVAIKTDQTQLPTPGAPETLLLIGSDHRAGQPYKEAQTDTMLLVRIDDSSSTVNFLSIPRDLAVNLPAPGGGVYESKLNAAYEQGGPNLLVKTLRQQVFPGLVITHILDVNFRAFANLVNAIGCVYSDIDQRYYNLSSGVSGDPNDFSSIDIQPGYQKLCGGSDSASGALAFVRYRHTDSDEVRNARQQDFIRWARDNYTADQLVENRNKLLTDFFSKGDVSTDGSLRTTDGILDLFDLIVNADGHTFKTISFPENFGPCTATACYVFGDASDTFGSPTSGEIAAYHKFMTPTQPSPTSSSSHHHHKSTTISDAGLTADTGDGKSQAGQLEQHGSVGLPIYYPKEIQDGSAYCFSITANCDSGLEPESAYSGSYPRRYVIHGLGRTLYKSYVMVLQCEVAGGVGANEGWFYTVQGTTWRHPPILKDPNKVITYKGRKLYEYSDGGKIAVVAMHTPQGAYWISNTLDNHIPNGQMVAMAASLTPAS